MRPEVGQTVTLAHAKRMAFGYSVLFLAALVIGWALWTSGAEGLALVVWMFGNGFTAFMGVLTVTWDVFEYLVPEETEDPPDPEVREISPNFGLSRDTRVALRVMAVLLTLTAVATLAFSYALGLL
jgi:hypothetical protein